MVLNKNHITIVLKPTDACNLRCLHCYHAETGYKSHKMELHILRKLIETLAPYYNDVTILWHGGEPLLMGCDFFEKAYQLFQSYSSKIHFEFRMQTNGTLLDQKIIQLLTKYNTKISISYDGIHNDILRQDSKIVKDKIIEMRDRFGSINCISTVSAKSLNTLIENYIYFKQLKVNVKFSPIIAAGAALDNDELLISKEEWVENFINLFDLWLYDQEIEINVEPCLDILKSYFKKGPRQCTNNGCLYQFISIDSNGNIYPCGRLISNDFLLSNILDVTDLREVFIRDPYKKWWEDTILRIGKCKKCKWFSRCHGGCSATAYYDKGIRTPSRFDCYFTQAIYTHIENLLKSLDYNKVNRFAYEIIKS